MCLAFGPGPVNNGKAVIAAGVAMDVPEEGIVAALAAAMQDTDLLNRANRHTRLRIPGCRDNDGLGVDRQAVGILQQGATWGAAGDRMSPATAAEMFFTSTRDIDGWDAMSPAELAGLVRRSAFPDAYADEVPAARQFHRGHLVEVITAQCPAQDVDTEVAPRAAHW